MAAHVNTILPLMRICKSMSPKMTRCLRRISNPLLSSQLSAVKFAPIQTAVPRCIHTTSICQAKKAKAKKGKATNKSPKAVAQEDFDEDLIPDSIEELIDIDELKESQTSIVNAMKAEFSEKLAVRTSQAAFNNLQVSVQKGKNVSLQYLGQITMKPPSTVSINLAANAQHVAAVRDALLKSALNVNPRIEGATIFVETPRVTREHREKLSKNAKVLADKYKVMLRDEQNSKTKIVKGAANIYREDDLRAMEKNILLMTQGFNKQIDQLLKVKQQELMSDS